MTTQEAIKIINEEVLIENEDYIKIFSKEVADEFNKKNEAIKTVLSELEKEDKIIEKLNNYLDENEGIDLGSRPLMYGQGETEASFWISKDDIENILRR